MKNNMEYYANNKERMLEYRKAYSKHYYQTVLKAKRSNSKTVKPKTVKPKTVKPKTVKSESVKPIVITQPVKIYPTQFVRGNFTLEFN
jgi:hypothetical protein